MKITYGKTLSKEENLIVYEISDKCGIQFDTARLLFYRGIDSVEKTKRYLHPSKNYFHNPFLFNDMKNVVERIKQAKENFETVLIYGDYDVDGICATTVLFNCLKDYGINALFTVPEREEGYGLNLNRIENISDEEMIDLIITVDCGISESENISELNDLGIDVIVTDHHEPPETLPNTYCINPKISNSGYPFNCLCGAGVAYKLGYALIGDKANKYLDLVALATVADSMELIGENRDIVYEGLKLINSNNLRPAFKYLIGDSNRNFTAQSLVFSLAPRINAGGRMGDANCALKLFTSNDVNEIYNLSLKLNEYNIERQNSCDNIFRQAKEKISKEKLYNDSVIMVADSSWQTGFTGIVAARLVEEYNRPVIAFAGYEMDYKGSARSIDDINIYEAISSASSLVEAFGGHSQAAGVTVSKDKFEEFRKIVCKYVDDNFKNIDFEKEYIVDWEVNKPLSLSFASEMEKMEPFGVGNRKPCFAYTGKSIISKPIKANSPHYSFNTEVIDMLDFNGAYDVQCLSFPIDKKILFEVSLSTFKEKTSIKGFVKKIIPDYSKLDNISLHIFRNNLLKLKLEESNFNIIDFDSIKIESGFGTLYLIDDEDNLKFYKDCNNIPRYLFNSESNNGKNCIVISPNNVSENYSKYIYLDKPNAILSKENSFVCLKYYGNKKFNDLSIDRDVFTEVFSILSLNNKKIFTNSVDFALNNDLIISKEQFIFSTEVFLELGFFKIVNGYLVRDYNQKSILTNSKIYSKICLIKGSVC